MTRIAVVGIGAVGRQHLDALVTLPEAVVVALVDGREDVARAAAQARGVPDVHADLVEALAREDIDAVILATPTELHVAQAVACLNAGKHVLVEIPLADSLTDAEVLLGAQREAGLVCMVGHTRRFNPGHVHLHERFASGALRLQHLVAQTFFFRRENINAAGEARGWTDHLLWHHAAHTVDLFAWQAGPIVAAHAVRGPSDPKLSIAMDMSIHLRAESGAICTLSLSFNNDGPQGTDFRYICDHGTWTARYDELVSARGEPVDLSGIVGGGVARQDRAFLAAITGGREAETSVPSVLPCYRTLDMLERQLAITSSVRSRR